MAPPLSLSTYASSYLRAPVVDHESEDEEDASPLFYSTLRQSQQPSRPPAIAPSEAATSTVSLAHVFGSQNSLIQDGSIVSESADPSRVLFDRRQEGSDNEDEDDDPASYLGRLEREEQEKGGLLRATPPVARPPAAPAGQPQASTSQRPPPLASTPSARGWLAHQSLYPSPHSSSSSASSSTSSLSSTSSADSNAHDYLDESEASLPDHSPRNIVLPRSERVTANSILGERLLPSPGEGVEVVLRLQTTGLGGQARWGGRGDWRKFRDSGFLALHLTCLLALFVFFPFTLAFRIPSASLPVGSPPTSTPFRTLLHTLPLLSIILIFALAVPPLFLVLLRRGARAMLLGTAVAVPIGLAAASWWLFVGSLEEVSGGGEQEVNSWWDGTGLRLLAIVPMLASLLAARLFWVRRTKLGRAVGVVELSIDLLLSHPPLLVLTPALLFSFALASIPFLTVLLRLFLLGYYDSPPKGTYVYHLKPKAGWLISAVVLLWVWTWSACRGIGRVTIAGVVGDWYFHRDGPRAPGASAETDPFGLGLDIEKTRLAFARATGPSLGSICLSSLIMTVVSVTHRSAVTLKRATSTATLSGLPSFLHPLNALEPIFGLIASMLDQLNGYTLVYVGITGQPFFFSARAVASLVTRRNRGSGRKLLDYTLVKSLLLLSTLTLSALSFAMAYLFAAHALHAPWHAPLAGSMCGGVVFLSVKLMMEALTDVSDSLFICYALDIEDGGGRCPKAAEAFGAIRPRPTGPQAV